MNKTLLTLTAAAGLATVAGLAMPTAASADDWHHGRPGGHREHGYRGDRGYWHHGYYRPAPYYGRPVAYYPRPVYYQPVAYHPVPYYAQPGIGLSFNFR